MPIYDYECRKCGERFEFLLLTTTVAACPACKSRKLEQLPPSGIAMSSAASRKANLQKAQRAATNSSDYRDKKMAELDDIKEHAPQMLQPIKKKKK